MSDAPHAPLSPAEALARVQDLKLRLEHWHIDDWQYPQEWLTFPEALEADGRTFRHVVLAGKHGRRPSGFVFIADDPTWDEVRKRGRCYNAPERLTDRSLTMWVFRDLWKRSQPMRGRPEWEHFLRTLDRLLDEHPHTHRELLHECAMERQAPLEELADNPENPRRWILTGRRVRPEILADLVDSARRLLESGQTDQRLVIDQESGTVTLDRQVYPVEAKPLSAFATLWRQQTARGGLPVSAKNVAKELDCTEKTIRRWLTSLPAPLDDLVRGLAGSGLRVQLPPPL
jgi:hypothetical protein